MDRRLDSLSQKETNIENREKGLISRESQLNDKHEKLNRLLEGTKEKLEKIAGISSDEARIISCRHGGSSETGGGS